MARAADPTDPATIHIALRRTDGLEVESHYQAEYDWASGVKQLLDNLGCAIQGIRVYDGNRVYFEEPLEMWGNC